MYFVGDGPLLRRRRTTDLSDMVPEALDSAGSSSAPSSSKDNYNSSETVTFRLRKSFGSTETPPDSPSPTPDVTTSKRLPSNSPRITVSDELPSPNTPRKTSSEAEPGTDAKPKKIKKKRLLIQGVQEVATADNNDAGESESPGGDSSADVAFIIQVMSFLLLFIQCVTRQFDEKMTRFIQITKL
jgi:hypothetical protein